MKFISLIFLSASEEISDRAARRVANFPEILLKNRENALW